MLIHFFEPLLFSNVRCVIELMQANEVALKKLFPCYRLRERRSWEKSYHRQHRASVGLHMPTSRVIPWLFTAPRTLKDSFKYMCSASLLQKYVNMENWAIPSSDLKGKPNANVSKALLNPWSFQNRNAILEMIGWTSCRRSKEPAINFLTHLVLQNWSGS